MLRIQRSGGPEVVFSLSGRIEIEDAAELERLIRLETAGQEISLDLGDVTLVDREALRSLARWEAEGIKLANCPPYIREWIEGSDGRRTG